MSDDRWNEEEPEYDPYQDDDANRPGDPLPKDKAKEKRRINRWTHHLEIMRQFHQSNRMWKVRSQYEAWCSSEKKKGFPPPPHIQDIIISFNERPEDWREKWGIPI